MSYVIILCCFLCSVEELILFRPRGLQETQRTLYRFLLSVGQMSVARLVHSVKVHVKVVCAE
jgi:hypothetical protein